LEWWPECSTTSPIPSRTWRALGDIVRDLVVGEVAPPEQDVRLRENVLGQAVLWLLKGRGVCLVARLGQHVGHVFVDTVGVEFGDLLVFFLVDVLVPDSDRGHTPAHERRGEIAGVRTRRVAVRRRRRS
jgi:hypothetical protein